MRIRTTMYLGLVVVAFGSLGLTTGPEFVSAREVCLVCHTHCPEEEEQDEACDEFCEEGLVSNGCGDTPCPGGEPASWVCVEDDPQ